MPQSVTSLRDECGIDKILAKLGKIRNRSGEPTVGYFTNKKALRTSLNFALDERQLYVLRPEE